MVAASSKPRRLAFSTEHLLHSVTLPFCVLCTIAIGGFGALFFGFLDHDALVMILAAASTGISLPVAYVAARLIAASHRGRDPHELRKALRRDLHDGLGPTITTASMRIETARNLLPHDPSAADAMLAQAHAEMRDVVTDMRELMAKLRPRCGPGDQALIQSLRELAGKFGRASGHRLRVRVDCPPFLRRMAPETKQAAYLIASEAMTNVVKHARASECLIRITTADYGMNLSVIDNGIGWPDDPEPGVGITSMLERASELGGACSISSGGSGGTEVRVFLPFEVPSGSLTQKDSDPDDICERARQ